jgi:hypothetical protein
MKSWSKTKPKLNLVIDAIMFVDLMAVAGLGFLMKYVLLPGYKINEVYGSGVELSFLGLDRHQWGTIHLILALFMVFLLVLHIIFHWDMILSIFRRMIITRRVRVVTGLLLGIIGLALVVLPFSFKPEVSEDGRKHNRNRVSGINVPRTADTMHYHYNQVEIDGTMTLNEISAKYNIVVEELAGVINVPVAFSQERLGRLRKRYDFKMDDLRVFVMSKSQSNEK